MAWCQGRSTASSWRLVQSSAEFMTKQLCCPEATSMLRMVRRASMTRGLSVWISIPGAAGVAQAGKRVSAPLTSTTQIRQTPVASTPGRWQRVGMVTPSAAAASRMVIPSVKGTVRPFRINSGISINPPTPYPASFMIRSTKPPRQYGSTSNILRLPVPPGWPAVPLRFP